MGTGKSVYGHVTSFRGTPIPMIKVGVYRNCKHLAHAFTDDAGRYDVSFPENAGQDGDDVALLFDTHPTLNNADTWHPSVVPYIAPSESMVINRKLLEVGHTGGICVDIEVLSSYQFVVVLEVS